MHLSRDSVKFCFVVLATWGSDMKIVYKISKECFYSPVIFSTLEISPSTPDILPSTPDILPSTLACKNSGFEIQIDLQRG